ncbi:deoxyuridine 5'-triphosphate nucleotidohydrolase, mitochondrial isoform X3 [Otolemur garnettii]|uniref:deoxyuridine 5'-triphosphate nucleotidohydrolase, mitochondrial isoform X3 n=1 Tax=Otolemur garnettii TaxID=30611 RepID=UPI000644081D|nr:deoxyuridine 5'-triphosphate nucleotidohydrolase, mitochondrial isoform X3 [Otolemur garnettii]
MIPLYPRPALCHHFRPSLLCSAFKNAASARQGAGAAGLSEPGPGALLRTLSSARRQTRGCSGASEVGVRAGRHQLSKARRCYKPVPPSPPLVVSPSKRARTEEKGSIQLRFARLSEHATAPSRGSARAAGYDLYSAYDYTIPPMEKAIVKTDIQIALPSGCYGRVAPRSGLAAKHFIDVGAGVIDEDYRGNVGVVLFNFGKEKFEVKKGDRIAQLICERIFYPEIEEVQVLDDTERGSGGFGSTGKN